MKFLKDYIAGFMVKVHPSNFSQTGRDILCILILESNVEIKNRAWRQKADTWKYEPSRCKSLDYQNKNIFYYS